MSGFCRILGLGLLLVGAHSAAAAPVTFGYTGAVTTYTLAATGNYRIVVAGAQGGTGGGGLSGFQQPGALGAIVGGTFAFTGGTVLQIAVGGIGGPAFDPLCSAGCFSGPGGGGGGSFVVNGFTPVAIAGGGGGQAFGLSPRFDATGGNAGEDGMSGSGPLGGAGGSAGGGGAAGGSSPGLAAAGGGGGFYADGGSTSAASGGTGFPGLPGAPPVGPVASGGGGFGGGGAAGGAAGGGGGGYSGGGGGGFSFSAPPVAFPGQTDKGGGGGGGSFLAANAADPLRRSAANSGFGYITIEFDPAAPPGVAEPGALALLASGAVLAARLRRRRAHPGD